MAKNTIENRPVKKIDASTMKKYRESNGKPIDRLKPLKPLKRFKGSKTEEAPTVVVEPIREASNENDLQASDSKSSSKFALSNSSGLIVFLGIPLVLVNGYKNGQLTSIWEFLTNATTTGTPTQKEKNDLLLLGGEILFLIILATFANSSKEFSNFAVVVLIALWIVWFMKNPVQLASITNALSGNQAQSNQPSIPSSPILSPAPFPTIPPFNAGLPFSAQNNMALYHVLNARSTKKNARSTKKNKGA